MNSARPGEKYKMARSFSFDSKRFEGFSVSPTDLTIDYAENGRTFPYTPEDIQDLLEDFQNGKGINQPVLVKPWKTDFSPKGLKVVAGYRRVYAALEWTKTNPEFTVPVIIEDPEDPLEELILNIRENVARKDLSHIDLGTNAQRLQAQGMTNEEISGVLGVSPAQVTQHIKLVVELPERLQFLVHIGKAKGGITADDAFAVLKLPAEERLGFVEKHLKGVGDEVIEADNEERAVSGDEDNGGIFQGGSGSSVARGVGSIRSAVRAAGGNVGSVRLPEFKKYLQQALDEDGPGSNKGEVGLKESLLDYLSGELTEKQLDNRFEKFCKQKGF